MFNTHCTSFFKLIPARACGGDQFEFQPQAKLCLQTNHKPMQKFIEERCQSQRLPFLQGHKGLRLWSVKNTSFVFYKFIFFII